MQPNPYKEKEMKKLILFMSIFAFTVPAAIAEPPQRKVVKPPNRPEVVRSQPRQFTRPAPQRPQSPNTAKPAQDAKPLPKGFGVPIQRPQGFGKQQWQKPQPQPQTQRPKVETRHSFGFYNYYNYYRPVNPHFRYYRAPSYYPPVIIQPQPMPIYPGPFHGFFFQFRF
jgi:hypothetical protein